MPKWNNLLAIVGVFFAALSGAVSAAPIVVVSVPDQRLALVDNGLTLAQYSVSTSKFGLGDRQASYTTPIGLMEVAAKIGDNLPLGAVLKHRQFTGEVLKPNAPGRDPIVTRILHLRGLDSGTAGAYDRGIYIHGTAEEKNIGRPASFGCIRMRSRDVIRLFNSVAVGTKVTVVNLPMTRVFRQLAAN